MRADEAFLHEADGVLGAADLVDLGQRRAGFLFQLFGLGIDHMAAIEDVLELEQVGLVGEDLLEAERPLLVPGTWQAHRLVPGRQLQGAAPRFFREGNCERFDKDSIDVVLWLRLGEAE